MERANSTITSDIDSERSPAVESQPLEDLEPEPVVVTNPKTVKKKTVVKKVVPKEPKEKIIETKDTTTIVNGTTENPDIVAPAVVTPTEELEPEPVVVTKPKKVVKKKIVRTVKPAPPKSELKPHQKEPVPRASDSGDVWPSHTISAQVEPQSLGSAKGQVWDPAEVFKTFQKQV